MTDTILYVILLVPCLIVALGMSAIAPGFAALLLGDRTAYDRGELSLNLIKRIDPLGTLILPGALALISGPILGWAKPVQVDPANFANRRLGMAIISAAVPASNLVMAMIAAMVLGALMGTNALEAGVPEFVFSGISLFILVNSFFLFFSLLPIPPFPGATILAQLLPRKWLPQWLKFQQGGIVVIVILFAIVWAFPNSGILEKFVVQPVSWLTTYYFGLAERTAAVFS